MADNLLDSTAAASLLDIFASIAAQKTVVLDKSISPRLDRLVKFSQLQDNGVDRMFWLESLLDPSTLQNHVVYILDASIVNARTLAGQLRMLLASSTHTLEFTCIMVPGFPNAFQQILADEGIIGDLVFHTWSPGLICVAPDLLSLELPAAGAADLLYYHLPAPVSLMVDAIDKIESIHGAFTRVLGKGAHAKALYDALLLKRRERDLREDKQNYIQTTSALLDNLVVIDRSIDCITPLMTQLTYTGLIDEFYGIQNSQIRVRASLGSSKSTSPDTAPSNGLSTNSGYQTVTLDPSEVIYSEIKDRPFGDVGKHLNRMAHSLNDQYESRYQAKTVSQIKNFVGKLSGLQSEHKSVALHTDLAEDMMIKSNTSLFNLTLEVQQNLVSAGLDIDTLHDKIDDMIFQQAPVELVLRAVCLESLIDNGIKPNRFSALVTSILHTYGHKHVLTIYNLERMGLLSLRNNSSSLLYDKISFLSLRKGLQINVPPSDNTTADISLPYAGYVPITTRLLETTLNALFLNHGATSRSIADLCKLLPGPFFDKKMSSSDGMVNAKETLGTPKGITMIVVLGGITYAELSTFRILAKSNPQTKLVFACTGTISGNELMHIATSKADHDKLK
ncbi:hypothetical protein CANCADRAFT_93368 [Tortispora caseinolytica NRRL Y-17796]|uniref:Sec1-like protein n=1 Tax=Tortispora caseinolytica NRRL Y-17796 TaxID=767744 RepID=A0A1E4TM29_9ASCO|nr:hypothetical protein CANCADRAFT_93368 [Tortispora caseinolytica NRRL Y-17796]